MGAIAKLWAEITANTSGLKTGLADAKNQLNSFGNSVKSSGAGLATAFQILTGAGAFTLAAKAIKSTIKTTVEYGDQIRELTRATGMSAEASSRMLQVADDSQVSFSDLTTAMKYAIKSGINPNIEGISALSDKYLALNSPLERSQMLLKQFGRNGLEMSKIMELGSEKINQIASSTDKYGLTLESLDVGTIREYEKSINDLQTALKGLGVQFALGVLPTLTKVVNGTSDAISVAYKHQNAEKGIQKLYKEGILTFQDYLSWQLRGVFTTEQFNDIISDFNYALQDNGMYFNENGDLIGKWGSKVLVGAEAVNVLQDAIEDLQTTQDTSARGEMVLGINLKVMSEGVGFVKQLKDQIKLIGLGGGNAQESLDTLKELAKINPDLAASIGKELLPEFLALDVAMGNMNTKEAIKSLMDVGYTAIGAKSALEGAGGSFSMLDGRTAEMHLYIYTHHIDTYGNVVPNVDPFGGNVFGKGQPGMSIPRGDVSSGLGPGGASGLSNFIVPPGYPGDSYPIRARSGERVDITPASETQVSNDALLAEMQAVRKSIEGLPIYIRDAMLVA